MPKLKLTATTDTTTLPAFLTVPDVAALTRRTPRSIYELVEKKLIPYTRPPGTRMIIFQREAILNWISPKEEKPQS